MSGMRGGGGRGGRVSGGDVQAQRAANASKNAADLVDRIVTSIKMNASNTMETREHIIRNNELALNVATRLDEIAVASDEHQVGITQIEAAISQISKITQDTSAKAAEITASSTRLNTQAENLNFYMDDLQTLVLGNGKNTLMAVEQEAASENRFIKPPNRGEVLAEDATSRLGAKPPHSFTVRRNPFALPPKRKPPKR